MRAGDISAIYIGEVIDAAPTPTPPIILKITNIVTFFGSAVPTAETKNRIAATISVLFLPNQSLSSPAIETPMVQPINALAATQPF
jgi:hypothetical protein